MFAWLKKHVVSLPRTDGTFLTEAEVCRATGMSRTPVREALLRLEADGLLRIVPKKGAFVPPITELEVEAIMQARGLVEDFCVRRAVHVGEFLARGIGPAAGEAGEAAEISARVHRARSRVPSRHRARRPQSSAG